MIERFSTFAVTAAWVMLGGMMLAGCASKPGEIFPASGSPIVWPRPPEPPRIAYVGQIATSGDLKPARDLGEGIGEALFGKKPDRSMLTPYAVCRDDQDRLFVADSNAQVVHVFDFKTRKYVQWTPANKEKRFAQPVGLAWAPFGRLYVADSAAGAIYAFDRNGRQVAEIRGEFLQRPCGLAYDASRNWLLATDTGLHRVLIFAPDGQLHARFGTRGAGLGEFNFPTNICVDSQSRFYVSDSLNFRIQQVEADLKTVRQIGKKGDMPGYFGQPKGIAVDSQNHLYVVDAHFEAVQIFSPDGQLLLDFGSEGSGPAEFWLPAGICIDSANRIWVADSYNRRVQVFDYLPEGAHEDQ